MDVIYFPNCFLCCLEAVRLFLLVSCTFLVSIKKFQALIKITVFVNQKIELSLKTPYCVWKR